MNGTYMMLLSLHMGFAHTTGLSIEAIKGIILALMFLVTFICSSIPVAFIKRIHNTHDAAIRERYALILSFLSCAAGGVFMGTCIMDLFPDVQEQMNKVMSEYESSRPFPIAEFIVIFGFLLVLAMEQMVLEYKEISLVTCVGETQSLLINPEDARQMVRREHSIQGISDKPDLTASIRSQASITSATGTIIRPSTQSHPTENTYGTCNADDGHAHTNILDHSVHTDISSHSALRSVMLLFALSLHSIFEGMAVGLQGSIDNVLGLFMVVIFHKGVIALSLSLNMVQSKLSIMQMMGANLIFCVTAPIGVAIGIGVMEMPPSITTSMLSGVLQGIACGTFLYVTFFEVLPHEMNNGSHRLIKLLCIIFGFTLVCGLLYIDPDAAKYKCYKIEQD